MELLPDVEEQLQKVNDLIPVHSMWDGFWIYDFDKGNLTVTCSFDSTAYRNFDIEFRNVSFFNIPSEWRDTDVPGDILFKLSNKEEFQLLYPEIEILDQHIFSLDLLFVINSKVSIKHCFHIVADRVLASQCLVGDARPGTYYKDPFENEAWPCFKNRVL